MGDQSFGKVGSKMRSDLTQTWFVSKDTIPSTQSGDSVDHTPKQCVGTTQPMESNNSDCHVGSKVPLSHPVQVVP